MRALGLLVEWAVIIACGYLLVTQILLPSIRGTRWWPVFRREGRLRAAVVDQNQRMYESEIADAIEQRRREWFGTSTLEETDAAQQEWERRFGTKWTAVTPPQPPQPPAAVTPTTPTTTTDLPKEPNQ